MDANVLKQIGNWVKANKGFIYDVKSCDIQAENADILKGKDCYYAVIKDVPMSADPNVQLAAEARQVCVHADIKNVRWLDDGKPAKVKKNSFAIRPFGYGESKYFRVAKFNVKE